jgi:TolB protein
MRMNRRIVAGIALFWLCASPSARASEGDESVLGTVVVDGSAGGQVLPPLPKLAVLPLLTLSPTDTTLQVVVKRDLDLSGQFEVIDAAATPGGPYMRDTPIEWSAWDKTKVETIVRVYADAKGQDTELTAEAFLAPPKAKKTKPVATGAGEEPPAPAAPPPKPAFTHKIMTSEKDLRANIHRLVDALLGGLTGRPGGFASRLIFTSRVGRWTQISLVDSDGFNLHPFGPNSHTIASPVFGPGNEIYYSISENFHRNRLAQGPRATPIPMRLPDFGALTGIAFSSDRKKFAASIVNDGDSAIYVSDPNLKTLKRISKEPLANFPSLGPTGQIAYAAGNHSQRIYVDGKAVSPPGFLASTPSFCDTPEGLYILLTVGIGMGSDVIAVESTGGRIRRLTQRTGANMYPACSPDGRLVAYFSRTKVGKGPGLYIAPILRPALAKKISDEVGEGLRWEPIDPPAP